MKWSKNVSNERDAPHQIILASMDANYDILLAFGLALEVMVDCCKCKCGEFIFCSGDKKNGYLKDEGNYYRHFKAQRRVSDRYCDTTLRWVDVKKNVVLCVGDTCAYKVKEGSGATGAWISQYVCPSIRAVYGKGIVTLLGK
eukprot:5547464-Ditylum_brightwellii.AAC.1